MAAPFSPPPRGSLCSEALIPASDGPAARLAGVWREKNNLPDDQLPVLSEEATRIITLPNPFREKRGQKPWFGAIEFEVCDQTWHLNEFVGSGAFGQSYVATHKKTGCRYVLKFLNRDRDPEIRFLTEASPMVFNHKNVVHYAGLAKLGKLWEPAKRIVFMEAIPNGELFDLIAASPNAESLTDGTMRRFVHDIINGMANLCKYRITHRDLKPENLLIDENGHVVIIDLGCARLYKWDEGIPHEAPVTPFTREQTKQIGTKGYHAPEHGTSRVYDSERAEVFTLGILIFLMKQPMPPFDPYFGGHRILCDTGVQDPNWWKNKYFQNFHQGSEELKALLNCLWSLNPKMRPTFDQLQSAAEGHAKTLQEFPQLAWLAGPVSKPLDFVLELRSRRPNLSLKCAGVVEALALYVRSFGNERDCSRDDGHDRAAKAAFEAARRGSTGTLTPSDLADALKRDNAAVTEEGTADVMRRYMDAQSQEMTLEEFQRMSREWQFGGRPIVHDIGRLNTRPFAWKPRFNMDSLEEEFQRFKSVAMDALAKCGEVTDHSLDHSLSRIPEGTESESTDTLQNAGGSRDRSFLVTMEDGLCQLHVEVHTSQRKFIVESRRVWGSSVEELWMLQEMNNDLVRTWGDRVPPPEEQKEDGCVIA